MDRCRAPTVPAVHRHGEPAPHGDADDPDELGVFAAERYFYGDDAPWCGRSMSSLSSAFRTGTHEHDRSVVPTPTAATSSSEASWNSRSALLHDGKVLAVAAAAAPSVVEAKPSAVASEGPGKRTSSSSHLRRWLRGVAGCACAGGHGGEGEEESVCADECRDDVEADNNALGVSCKNRSTGAFELFPRTESKELAVEEATAVRVRPGRWLDDGGALPAGSVAFSSVQLAGDDNRRAAYSDGLSKPISNPATTDTSDERWRKSLEIVRPVGGHGSALCSATQNSAFTIVAGNSARPGALHAAVAGGRGSPCAIRRDSGEDDAVPSELECAYPPSEASVVWSVVTADGAASSNFSSAASGYYYHHYFKNGEHEVRSNGRRRRSGVTSSGGLLTCMSEKAVDAVGPAPSSVHRPELEPAAVARLGAAGGRRNGPGGGCRDVMRRQ